MVKLSETTKEKLQDLGVAIVYLFGSQAQGTASAVSDYDIGVVFGDIKRLLRDSVHLHSRIYDILTQDIPDEINGQKLDISFLQKANAALQAVAIKQGYVLFESDPAFRADFEEQVVRNYDDYLPIKRAYEQATITAFTP